MANQIFNSPRYDKKSLFIDGNLDQSLQIISIYGIVFSAFFGIVFFNKFIMYTKADDGVIGMLISFITLVCSCCIYIYAGDMVYSEYIKNINKKKKIFHTGDKKPYILPDDEPQNDPFDKDFSKIRTDLMLRLMSIMIKADKEERVVELQKAQEILYRFEKKQNRISRYYWRLKEVYLKEDFYVEDVAYSVYWKFGNEREAFMMPLFELAYADGDFCEYEEYMLRYIAYHMYITETEYKKMVWKFCKSTNDAEGKYTKWEKARYKRDGGYWYYVGTEKRWHKIDVDDEESKEDNSKSTKEESKGTDSKEDIPTPPLSPELQKAYSLLGISVDAIPSEIKACKRNLLRLNHPDLVAHKGQEAVDAATLKCQRINQAYEYLKEHGKC